MAEQTTSNPLATTEEETDDIKPEIEKKDKEGPRLVRCPICEKGILEKHFTWNGVLMGIAFFPIGLILCHNLRKWKCRSCGETYD